MPFNSLSLYFIGLKAKLLWIKFVQVKVIFTSFKKTVLKAIFNIFTVLKTDLSFQNKKTGLCWRFYQLSNKENIFLKINFQYPRKHNLNCKMSFDFQPFVFKEHTPKNSHDIIIEANRLMITTWRNQVDTSYALQQDQLIVLKFIEKVKSLFKYIQKWNTNKIVISDLGKTNNLKDILYRLAHIKFENLKYLNLFYLKITNIESLSFIFCPSLEQLKIDQNESSFSLTPLIKANLNIKELRINLRLLKSNQQQLICSRGQLKLVEHFLVAQNFNQIVFKKVKKDYGGLIPNDLFIQPYSIWMNQPDLLIKSNLPFLNEMFDKESEQKYASYYNNINNKIYNDGAISKRVIKCFAERFKKIKISISEKEKRRNLIFQISRKLRVDSVQRKINDRSRQSRK